MGGRTTKRFRAIRSLRQLAMINNEHQQLHQIKIIQNYDGQHAQKGD